MTGRNVNGKNYVSVAINLHTERRLFRLVGKLIEISDNCSDSEIASTANTIRGWIMQDVYRHPEAYLDENEIDKHSGNLSRTDYTISCYYTRIIELFNRIEEGNMIFEKCEFDEDEHYVEFSIWFEQLHSFEYESIAHWEMLASLDKDRNKGRTHYFH